MFGHRFASGTQKLETAPRGFFQHPDFKKKIRYFPHLFHSPIDHEPRSATNVVETQTENLLL
jgi:hypothetical protein